VEKCENKYINTLDILRFIGVATARKILSIMRAKLISGEVFNEKLILHQEQLKRAQQEWEQNEKQLRSKMRNFYN
jgi:hypothetical protein